MMCLVRVHAAESQGVGCCFEHVCQCKVIEVPDSLACVQDMYTRLLSANLDFDSELKHVFCWAPGECRDSRVFHGDRVFLRLC